MSMRLRRLKADYDRICTCFSGKSRVRLLQAIGDPPEKYQLEFLVKSLQKPLGAEQLRLHNSFIAEITLTKAYPRLAPQCRLTTPVFHPNIAPHAICIGDHWAAGESLVNLVVRIAEMLAYQSYNVKSPLNGEAAQWVEKNRHRLPLDEFDFNSLLVVGEAVGRRRDGSLKLGGECANCGRKATDGVVMAACKNAHVACPDCLLECPHCGGQLCLKCQIQSCYVCRQSVCVQCIWRCSACSRLVCREHARRCSACNEWRCPDCLVYCARCHKGVCVNDVQRKTIAGKKQYYCPTCAG